MYWVEKRLVLFFFVLLSVSTVRASNADSTLSNVEVATDNFAKLSDSLVNANLGQTIEKLQGTISNFDNILAGIDSDHRGGRLP